MMRFTMPRWNVSLGADTTNISGTSCVLPGVCLRAWNWMEISWETAHPHWPPVLPAGCDMRDDTGMRLFADVDPIDFDNALSRVKTSCCSHGSFKDKWKNCQKLISGIIFVFITYAIRKAKLKYDKGLTRALFIKLVLTAMPSQKFSAI